MNRGVLIRPKGLERNQEMNKQGDIYLSSESIVNVRLSYFSIYLEIVYMSNSFFVLLS